MDCGTLTASSPMANQVKNSPASTACVFRKPPMMSRTKPADWIRVNRLNISQNCQLIAEFKSQPRKRTFERIGQTVSLTAFLELNLSQYGKI